MLYALVIERLSDEGCCSGSVQTSLDRPTGKKGDGPGKGQGFRHHVSDARRTVRFSILTLNRESKPPELTAEEKSKKLTVSQAGPLAITPEPDPSRNEADL